MTSPPTPQHSIYQPSLRGLNIDNNQQRAAQEQPQPSLEVSSSHGARHRDRSSGHFPEYLGSSRGHTGTARPLSLRDEEGAETWLEFLKRTKIDTERMDEPPSGHAALAAAAERKRRANNQTESQDAMRRRPSHTDASASSSSTSNTGIGSSVNPIDLTLSPTEPTRRPSTTTESRNAADIVIPKWQPDAEASDCPICHTPFTFFYRKHHCRKCGRVVCANCSPHRITIPRQFIVQPPESISSPSLVVVDLTEDASGTFSAAQSSLASPYPDAAFGGGEVVRLCNPCVPDPQPVPPSQPYVPREASGQSVRYSANPRRPNPNTHHRGTSSPYHAMPRYPVSDQERYLGLGPRGDLPNVSAEAGPATLAPRRRGVTFADPPTTMPRTHVPPPSSSAAAQPPYYSHRFPAPANPNFPYPHAPNPRHSAPVPQLPIRSLLDLDTPLPPPPPPPRPQLREEDYCPICFRPLPPMGTDNDPTPRERHIDACIIERTSSPARPPPSTSNDGGDIAPIYPPRRRRPTTAGMYTWQATEKDCVGEDSECPICMVEYEPGDELGRLECMCKFHRLCIRAWWDKKGPGACPKHIIYEEP